MKKFIYALVIIIILIVVGILIYRSSKAKTTSDTAGNTTTTASQPVSLVSADIIMPDAVATIYYGNGCPHCTNLEKWLQENKYLPGGSKIDQTVVDNWIATAKVKFNMKEVWYNKTNSAELTTNATTLGLPSDQVGVPFLFDSVNKKSFVGETDIQTFFTTQTK
ncbi:MAG: hypothetical protein NTY30_03660 [Candidatus Berkelbacteria bacterium]|nr:hypothetical protein [Candidatus Berkelbacteria bacterium]